MPGVQGTAKMPWAEFKAMRDAERVAAEIKALDGVKGAAEVTALEGAKGVGKVELSVGKSDLDVLRTKWNVPETQTVAVGKTDVKGLEGIKFEGASPKVLKEAGLPSLDEIMPNRLIKGPSDNPLFIRHAEEHVFNQFDQAVSRAGINPNDVTGTLRVHQSNPAGVCKKCIQGLSNDSVSPGVVKQLSLKYPDLTIEITSEVSETVKVSGKSTLIVKNGKYNELMGGY